MLQALQFMSVRQRLYYNVCIFIFKILNGLLPEILKCKCRVIGNEGRMATRQLGNIDIGFRKTSSAQKSVFFDGLGIYNALPVDVKRCTSLAIFKRRLRDYVMGKINTL